MSDEELPYVLVEKHWLPRPRYEVYKNTLKNRVIEKDGQVIYQYYNYSGWVNRTSERGRIVDRFPYGREAGRAKMDLIAVSKVTLA